MSNEILYETERLQFRRYTYCDIDFLQNLSSDDEVMRFLDKKAFSSNDIARQIDLFNAHFDNFGFGTMLVLEKQSYNRIASASFRYFSGIEQFNGLVEIGWRIAKDYWNKGYATEISRKIFTIAFEQLNFNEVIAIVSTKNIASIRALEKSGMKNDELDTFVHPQRTKELNPYRMYKITRDMYYSSRIDATKLE